VQLVTITTLREASLGMSQQEKQINANSSSNMDTEVLEQGDIYCIEDQSLNDDQSTSAIDSLPPLATSSLLRMNFTSL
jgi:hypothetical protein